MTEIVSKHGIVSKAPYMLYMSFVDMRNFVNLLPEEKRAEVEADYDTIKANVQGFNIGVKVADRVPYSKIVFKDNGAPFTFTVTLFFDAYGGEPDKTDFHIEVEADLNFMMKMMLSSKIKDGLDKLVDGLVSMSEGRLPEGVDPSMFPEGFDPEKFSKGF